MYVHSSERATRSVIDNHIPYNYKYIYINIFIHFMCPLIYSCVALYINIYYIARHITYVVTILIIQNNLTYAGYKALAIKH